MKYFTWSLLIIVIISLVTLSIYNKKIKEHFVLGDEEVPLKSINLCGRNLSFPYFARNLFTASQRALADNTMVKTNPEGQCRITSTNGIVNISHSILHENSLFYNLKYACLAFRVTRIEIQSSGNLIYLTFASKDTDDINNLLNLILLNPVYVEFMVSSDVGTTAYRIPIDQTNNGWVFSNADGIKSYESTYRLPFVRVDDPSKTTCDKTFNNTELSPNKRVLNQQDINTIMGSNNGIINMKAYYIDPLPSFQTIGRFYKPEYSSSEGRSVIFEKDYQKYYNDSYSTQKYEFMNNIGIMYTNSSHPVFTFNFSINVTPADISTLNSNKLLICRIYMDNNIGKYNLCQSITQDLAGGPKVNNILAVLLEGKDNLYYNANFFIGRHVGSIQNNECNFLGAKTLRITLPYTTPNSNTNITVTVTPNERIVMATWFDVNQGDLSKQVVFAKMSECSTNTSYNICSENKQNNAVDNSLYKLFKSTPQAPLENIYMSYLSTKVKAIGEVNLGYTNLLKEFKSTE